MKQHLSHDSVSRYIAATPESLYDLVSDVTRTPELSDDIVSCAWLDGATGPAVGARFKAVNNGRGRPNWSNKPIVTVADPGRELVFARTEPFAGTIQWRYVFTPEDGGTVVTESYAVVRPLTVVGWFVIGVLYGHKDRATELRASMSATLERIAEVVVGSPRRA
jgi:Polyketide cyclase / dehydrase and lipid transport